MVSLYWPARRRPGGSAAGWSYADSVETVKLSPGEQLAGQAERVEQLTAAVSNSRVGNAELAWLGREVAAAVRNQVPPIVKDWALLSADGVDFAAVELEANLGSDGPTEAEIWLHPNSDPASVLPAALGVCRDFAREHGRNQLTVWYLHASVDEQLRSPTGIGSVGRDVVADLLVSAGARLAQVYRVSEVDPLESGEPEPPADGYRLVHWFGPTPARWRAQVAAMHEITMADAPTGETGYVAEEFTAERVAADEASAVEAGRLLVSVLALAPDDAVAGLTQVAVQGGTTLAYQWDTSVASGHRGRGLGRSLKTLAAALVREQYPQVRRIITHNAADNVHMLRINTDLGWRPLAHKGLWSLSVS